MIDYCSRVAEGSWIQGGGGKPGGLGSGNIPEVLVPPMNIGPGGYTEAPGGGRSNLGQSPGMGLVQVGPSNVSQGSSGPSNPHIGPNMHHYKGIIPSFVSSFLFFFFCSSHFNFEFALRSMLFITLPDVQRKFSCGISKSISFVEHELKHGTSSWWSWARQ